MAYPGISLSKLRYLDLAKSRRASRDFSFGEDIEYLRSVRYKLGHSVRASLFEGESNARKLGKSTDTFVFAYLCDVSSCFYPS